MHELFFINVYVVTDSTCITLRNCFVENVSNKYVKNSCPTAGKHCHLNMSTTQLSQIITEQYHGSRFWRTVGHLLNWGVTLTHQQLARTHPIELIFSLHISRQTLVVVFTLALNGYRHRQTQLALAQLPSAPDSRRLRPYSAHVLFNP